MMKQQTSKMLYEYWNSVRNGRIAPRRFEIQPIEIAALLPETFIAECAGISDYRIRLAGTRICEHFGRELRGDSLLDFWKTEDREGLVNLLHAIVTDGAVGIARFSGRKDKDRGVDFEMVLMPLIHTGTSVNRIFGCITAVDLPFWLGTAPLDEFELKAVDIVWPDGAPYFMREANVQQQPALSASVENSRLAGDGKRQFKVIDGGLTDQPV